MFTNEEKQQMINHTNVYRNDCERRIRKIRRNKAMLDEQFNSIPAELAEDEGIFSPDEDIEYLKECKAKAVIIKKKLNLI